MMVGPQSPEKGIENGRRARIGSETGTVAGIEKGTGTRTRTRRGTVTGVTVVTGTVTAITGSAGSKVREVNSVTVLMTVIVTGTEALILKGEGTVKGMVTVGIGLVPDPLLGATDLDLVLVQKASV
jgi:hypothetical protein